MRKEIKEILNNPYYSDDDDCLDKICSLIVERLDGIAEKHERNYENAVPDIGIDQLIKELRDEKDVRYE